MVWFVLFHLGTFLVDLLTTARRADCDKDLEILLLRHQLRVLQRQRPRSPRLSRWEKLTLAVLTAKLSRLTAGPRARLDQVQLLVKPETVLRWHARPHATVTASLPCMRLPLENGLAEGPGSRREGAWTTTSSSRPAWSLPR